MYDLHHSEAGRSCVCVTLLMLQATFVFTLTWNSCFKNKRYPIDVQKFWMWTVTSLGLSFTVLALNLMSLMKVLQVTGSSFCQLQSKEIKFVSS